MPDNDGATLLSRQSKRRRVDTGVKRTAGGAPFSRGRETPLDAMSQPRSPGQEGDCPPLVGHGAAAAAAANGEVEKSNVLRKLLKRANSYEESMMAFPGSTIISQLLKTTMGQNGGNDSGFQGSGTLSSGGSEIQGEDVCSNSSFHDQDSPSHCLSPSLPAPSTFGRPPPPPPTAGRHLLSAAPPPPPPPALSLSSFDLERLTDEHLRAKRARVENIIRGMSHSPLVRSSGGNDRGRESGQCRGGGGNRGNAHCNDDDGSGRADCVPSLLRSPGPEEARVSLASQGGQGGQGVEVFRENKRKQRLPQQQQQQQQRYPQRGCSRQEQRQEERRQLKLQLEDMQKQLRQLQEKFYQIYDSETEEEEEEEEEAGESREEDGNLSEDSIRSDGLEESHGVRTRRRRRRCHDDDDHHHHPSRLDPGLFLDRARALLRERVMMGEGEEEEEEEEEEERSVGRVTKRRGGGGGRGGGHLAETLKLELNCAVSQVVDHVVKGFSSPRPAATQHHGCHADTPAPPSSRSNSSVSCPAPYAPLPPLTPDLRFGGGGDGGGNLGLDCDVSPAPNYHSSNQRLLCFGNVRVPSPPDAFGGAGSIPAPHDQTEALSLVVRKGGGAGGEGAGPSLPPPHPHHPALHPTSALSASLGFSPPAAFRHPFPLPLMGYHPFQGPLGGSPHGVAYPPVPKDHHHHHHLLPASSSSDAAASVDRTKMAALGGGHHLGHHHHHHHHHHRQSPPGQHGGGPEGLLLCPLVKSECGDLQDLGDISPYSSTIQEGLSPNHLKKAKLMFFFTRYPSSNMLKMFFSDVKFNRCITSQLIKWFSNFREFYYIQMEKFARQAINEGVATAEELSVGRDAELYRALNMHYNKANDFQVPERFLEVAQVTLREFFNAIVAGKDVDPSWKKAIYKVICKLDSEVPDIFKSASCLQELLHD